MIGSIGCLARCRRSLLGVALLALLPVAAIAADVDVFHADSLAGPMRELKHAFEAKNAGVNLRLTSGVSIALPNARPAITSAGL